MHGKKKSAVALNKSFFDTLPPFERVPKAEADIAWLIYELEPTTSGKSKHLRLTKVEEVYTRFAEAMITITNPNPGSMDNFMHLLQERLDERLESSPVNKTIDRPF